MATGVGQMKSTPRPSPYPRQEEEKGGEAREGRDVEVR